jgi:hypothetical protein
MHLRGTPSIGVRFPENIKLFAVEAFPMSPPAGGSVIRGFAKTSPVCLLPLIVAIRAVEFNYLRLAASLSQR